MKTRMYKELRDSGNQPRVHGNGFIQLDIPGGGRLHVWDDEIPRQEVSTPLHDHAFGFKSKVICGVLLNYVLEIGATEDGNFMVHTPQRREGTEDTKLMPTGEVVGIKSRTLQVIPAGVTYEFDPLVFHETDHFKTTATILTKTTRLDVEPRVLVPIGTEPDNVFDREAFDPKVLWGFVERACELATAMEEVDWDSFVRSL